MCQGKIIHATRRRRASWRFWGLLSVCAVLPAAGWALPALAGELHPAALMSTITKGVNEEKKEVTWKITREVMAQYYTLLPEEQVASAEQKAQAAGCVEEACLEAVRKELGVPAVFQLRHVDEGYFNPLYMTRVSEEGTKKEWYMCSRCTMQEFKVIMNRLMHKFEQ